MLIECGCGKQTGTWHVLESKPPMYARIYYILGGKTKYIGEFFTCEFKQGYLYILPSHAPYEMKTDPADALECMHMHLDLQAVNLSHLIELNPAKDPDLQGILMLIRRAVENDYSFSYLESLACCFEKFCLFKKILETVDSETAVYINVIRENYRTGRTMREIALSLGYSEEYFIRRFKEKAGISPHQYAISLRMSDATRMLTGKYTLGEIAAAVGYNDGHSFSNAFRHYYGISPKDYREKYASNI